MSNEVKQLRLQLKERDARISQLEASEKHWKQEFDVLEAEVLACLPMVRQAKEILNAYTTGLHVLTALAEQTKENPSGTETRPGMEETPTEQPTGTDAGH